MQGGIGTLQHLFSGRCSRERVNPLDDRVGQCAFQLQDKVLIAKLNAGDLISQEAIHYAKCLVSLYNKPGRLNQNTEDGDEKIIKGIALAQLVSHIEESRAESVHSIPVFQLAALAEMYSTRLQQLGGDVSSRIHFTDLKDRILGCRILGCRLISKDETFYWCSMMILAWLSNRPVHVTSIVKR